MYKVKSNSSTLPPNFRPYLPNKETPWHVSSEVFQKLLKSGGDQKYSIKPNDPEWPFIDQCFSYQTPPNRSIKHAYCIHNPEVTRKFEANIPTIDKRAQDPFFAPKLNNETLPALRKKTLERWEETAKYYSPFSITWEGKRKDTYSHAKILPLWHGSNSQTIQSIAKTGFTFFGKQKMDQGDSDGSTDQGFFGSGIYFTNSPRYAADIYSDGNLLLAWVSMKTPYPVVADVSYPKKPDDMRILEGKGAYSKYNAHYIPVISIDPKNEKCAVYYPCTKDDTPALDEFVVFESSQTLPRFWIELQIDLVKSLSPLTTGTLLDKVLELLDHSSIQNDPTLSQLLEDKMEFLFIVGEYDPLSEENHAFYMKITRLLDTTGKVRAVVSKQLKNPSPIKKKDFEEEEKFTDSPKLVKHIQKTALPKEESFPKTAFGKAKWKKYFGDIGVEPPLPKDIVEVLKSPCPYWGGKRVEETHMLVLIPQAINGKPLTLNTLQQLIQAPQGEGHATKYEYYYKDTQKEIGGQSVPSSYWALITKDVLPNSRSKTYAEQQALIKGPYAVPGALEIATGILMHHAQTGERLYSDSPDTYTRCQEKLSNGYRVVVGSFGSSGLHVGSFRYVDDGRIDYGGLGGVRKF